MAGRCEFDSISSHDFEELLSGVYTKIKKDEKLIL
jgi:hypothetical protein